MQTLFFFFKLFPFGNVSNKFIWHKQVKMFRVKLTFSNFLISERPIIIKENETYYFFIGRLKWAYEMGNFIQIFLTV